MAYTAILVASTAVLLGASVWRYRLELRAVHAFGLAWVLLIAGPSAIAYGGVDTPARDRLFLATSIVNVALLVAVLLGSTAWFRKGVGRFRAFFAVEAGSRAEPQERAVPRWFWMALAVSLATFLVHAWMMPRIPLVALLGRNDLTMTQLTELREGANKLLSLPMGASYLLNWNIRVVVPILLTVLALRGGWGTRIIVMPVLVGLTAMTLEKSHPTLAIVATGLGVAVYRRSSLVSRPVLAGLVLGFGVLAGLALAMKARDDRPSHPLALPAVGAPGEPPGHAADAGAPPAAAAAVGTSVEAGGWRGLPAYAFVFIRHRVFAGPSHVAYNWFDYFPDVSGGFLHGRSWLPWARSGPGFEHPAHLVGLYAYHRKDPRLYLRTAYAYAAFHADAWANFGYAGVILASLVVAGLLLFTEVGLGVAVTPLMAGTGGAALSILLTTLPGGGVQAALIPQGLVLCFAMLAASAWWRLHRAGAPPCAPVPSYTPGDSHGES